MTNSLTIWGLALDIYLRNHHKNKVPLINRKGTFEYIKKSYYEGITEVYIPINIDADASQCFATNVILLWC